MPRDHPVLVVDDDVTPSQVKQWFRSDTTERADGERFVLYGICDTEQELQDELSQGSDALPDLVLLDDQLQSTAGLRSDRKALDMVRWIAERFGDGRPRRILTTGSPSPTYCHAFCELGGHHVIDKHRPLERLRIMWATIDGHVWEPDSDGAIGFSVVDTNAVLLPYMEHVGWRKNAARDLGIAEGNVGQRKTRLATALGLPGDADRTEFVEQAHRKGLVWVPLIYRHLLPPDHPEHRRERFVPELRGDTP